MFKMIIDTANMNKSIKTLKIIDLKQIIYLLY